MLEFIASALLSSARSTVTGQSRSCCAESAVKTQGSKNRTAPGQVASGAEGSSCTWVVTVHGLHLLIENPWSRPQPCGQRLADYSHGVNATPSAWSGRDESTRRNWEQL